MAQNLAKLATSNPAAYGGVPSAPTPHSTAGENTNEAINNQLAVYNQLPGYSSDLSSIGKNIASETSGQLPSDVINQIQQGAAERGIATGSPGSPNSNASYLQALGLNSLGLTNMGQQNFSSILPGLPGSSIASNPSFYTTPSEMYEAGLQNNIFSAMPNPMAAAQAGLAAAQSGVGAGAGAGGMGTFSLPPTPSADAAPPPSNADYGYNLDYRSDPTTGSNVSTQDWLSSIISDYAKTTNGSVAPQQGWTDPGFGPESD